MPARLFSFTSRMKRAMESIATDEVLVTLLNIEHPTFAAPIRLCNDAQNLTSNGVLYTSFPFSYSEPDVMEGNIPTALLTADNVDQMLLEAISDLDDTPVCNVGQVLRSDPDNLVFPFIPFKMGDYEVFDATIQIPLVLQYLSDAPYGLKMDRSHFPMMYTKT